MFFLLLILLVWSSQYILIIIQNVKITIRIAYNCVNKKNAEKKLQM